jgi:NAD(P)H-dependent FMN reductase
MMQRKKVLAISGSTRKESSNLQIIKAIARLSADSLDMDIFQELDSLPHFNPDLDGDQAPPVITAFRHRISEAAGVLICTPEYVFSLPGSLKNAIEWMVSTTTLITAFTREPNTPDR